MTLSPSTAISRRPALLSFEPDRVEHHRTMRQRGWRKVNHINAIAFVDGQLCQLGSGSGFVATREPQAARSGQSSRIKTALFTFSRIIRVKPNHSTIGFSSTHSLHRFARVESPCVGSLVCAARVVARHDGPPSHPRSDRRDRRVEVSNENREQRTRDRSQKTEAALVCAIPNRMTHLGMPNGYCII